MSAEMIERTYGHHNPDYMRAALETIAERFFGHSIGQPGKWPSQAEKKPVISWWAREIGHKSTKTGS
ncbi:MAG TPA: hypothetical protein VGJ20_27825 [Xanthobacteraceae bacterium]